MTRVLVTGRAGYIGSHTVLNLLQAGHDVLPYDNYSTAPKNRCCTSRSWQDGRLTGSKVRSATGKT